MSDKDDKSKRIEEEEHKDERIEKIGQLTLNQNAEHKNIHLLSIIGEIEGHDNLSGNSKTTKYEHILPQLAAMADTHFSVEKGEADGRTFTRVERLEGPDRGGFGSTGV